MTKMSLKSQKLDSLLMMEQDELTVKDGKTHRKLFLLIDARVVFRSNGQL